MDFATIFPYSPASKNKALPINPVQLSTATDSNIAVSDNGKLIVSSDMYQDDILSTFAKINLT